MLADPGDAKFDAILIATGSEVDLAMQAMRALAGENIAVRVVSMPCANVFDGQPLEYRESVLPSWCRKRVAVEAGVKFVNAGSAEIETIKFLREMLSAKFGIKASGEITEPARANELLEAGATHFAATVVPQV